MQWVKNMSSFFKGIKKPFMITLCLLLICGLGYPLLLTGISKVFFPSQSGGSLIMIEGQAMGSELVGQNFTDNRFMKSRPSAVGYNTYTSEDKELGNYSGVSSGSKNYGPSNTALTERVKNDIETFLEANPTVKQEDIPTDLLTASGSGLDPHISPASAIIQIPALVETTGLSSDTLEEIVENNTKGKILGIFGEETVNVLMVNLDIAKELGIIK